MRCRHRLSKLLLRHGIRFEDGPAWTHRHRDWLAAIDARLAGGAGDDCSTPCGAIDALVHRRDALEREIAALLPGSPWATPGRAAALPARDRHADRGRAVRRDRRLRALRARRAADELRRAGALESTPPAHSRRLGAITKTGSGHARRLLVEAAWHYRNRPRGRQSARRPPSRPTRRSDRDRLERATAPAPHLDTARAARQAPHDHRRRRRPRTHRLLLGHHPHRITEHADSTCIPSAGSVAARQRAGNPRPRL